MSQTPLRSASEAAAEAVKSAFPRTAGLGARPEFEQTAARPLAAMTRISAVMKKQAQFRAESKRFRKLSHSSIFLKT
jgi:hypothetical protein